MAILRLEVVPSSKLRKVSKPVRNFNRLLANLVQDMFDTMYHDRGVGLAAVQVGVLTRVFITDDTGSNPRVFVNPQLFLEEYRGYGTEVDMEGCLSIPGTYGLVERNKVIRIRYQDLSGKLHEEEVEGFLARIIQHEYDHLEGVLFTDKAIRTFSQEELEAMRGEEERSY